MSIKPLADQLTEAGRVLPVSVQSYLAGQPVPFSLDTREHLREWARSHGYSGSQYQRLRELVRRIVVSAQYSQGVAAGALMRALASGRKRLASPNKSRLAVGAICITPTFSELQMALGRRQAGRFVFIAFDLLHLDGMDFRRLPLVVRRERLASLIADSAPMIQFSEALPGTPQEVFDVADRAGLEGVVCKLAESRYRSGRTRDWLKVKAFEEADFELIGVRREQGKPAMALMARNGRYAGGAFITLPAGIRERLWQRIEEKTGPAPKKLKPAEAAHWVKPGIVGRVRYLKGEEMLRHATLKDWREDN